jgi:hypothetical protein
MKHSAYNGTVVAYALIDFSCRKNWRAKLLESASELSNQIQDGWKTCCEAYDDGLFKAT